MSQSTVVTPAESNQPLSIDPPALEAALRALWHEAARDTEGRLVATVRVLNLIVYAENEECLELAEQVLAVLPDRHPCRVLLLDVSPQEERPLEAFVSARCVIMPGGRRKVCSEVITIRAGRETRSLLVDAVRPLLVADLPAVLWWTGRPRPADPLFRRFAAGIVDRVLLDSTAFRDPAAGLLALSRWRSGKGGATIADLAWERLLPWRRLLAETLDMAPSVADRREIVQVALGYHGETAPEEALLKAGWLAASYRWEPEDSPGPGVITFNSSYGPVTMRFVAEGGSTPEALRSIQLVSAGGTVFRVHAQHESGNALCNIGENGQALVEQTAPFMLPDASDLVVAALEHAAPDPVYAASLAAAAELAVLGATA